MLENLENPFLKFNFLVTIMFHIWTIWRTLQNCPNVEYSKGGKVPSWKEHHIKASLFCGGLIFLHQSVMMWTGYLVYITIGTTFENRTSQWLFCKFTIWFQQKFFSSEKNLSMFGLREWLNLLKSFAAWSFLLSFIACDKNWPFLILYEKYWMFHAVPAW